MANTNAASGATPLRYLSGAAYTGAVNRYKKEASVVVAPGDFVVLTGTAETTTGIPLVTLAAATGTITGCVVAIEPVRSNLSQKHLGTGDSGYVLVADEPDLLFVMQEDSVGGAMAVTAVGEFVDVVYATADTTIGLSKNMIDSSDAGTGDNLRIIECLQREDNEVAVAYAKWVVLINEHTYRAVQTPI